MRGRSVLYNMETKIEFNRKNFDILVELLEDIESVKCNFPDWWYRRSFTTREFGEKLLSNNEWWDLKTQQLMEKEKSEKGE